jgi:iron(III) transport system permease protein
MRPLGAMRRAAAGRGRLLVGAALLGVLVAYPVAMLLVGAVAPELPSGSLDGLLDGLRRIGGTEGVPSMLANSVLWAGATTLIAWGLGVPIGYLLARTDLRGAAAARVLILVPMMTPPYILALSLTMLMQAGGLGDRWFPGLVGPLRDAFFSFWGVAAAMALALFGLVALLVEATLRSLPARLDHAAAMLGAGWWARTRAITLPLLRPAILNAGLLVFLDAISNFGVPAVLGPRANLPLLPAEIHALVTSWPVDLPLAAGLSSLLLVIAIGGVLASGRLLRGASMPAVRSAPHRHRLGPLGQVVAWGGIAAVAGVGAAAPYAAMVATSLAERWTETGMVLSLAHYRSLFAPGSRGLQGLLTSLALSAGAATLCVILGGFVAHGLARGHGALARTLEVLAMLPRVLPKMAMAVAIILAWNAPWIRVPVYGTVWILLIAYVALYLSDALRYADAGMRQVPARLEHAAESLGASRMRSFLSITLPLLRPSLAAAWVVTFLVCMRDLVASVLLLPAGAETAGSFIFSQFEQGEVGAAMAMATVVTLTSVAVLLTLRLRGSGGG